MAENEQPLLRVESSEKLKDEVELKSLNRYLFVTLKKVTVYKSELKTPRVEEHT